MRLVLATRNPHKLAELRELLAPHEVLPLPETVKLPRETGSTFLENALIKARAAAAVTGSIVVADDSGIEAAALDGAPGVYSARFAGEDATDEQNLARLLHDVRPDADTRVAYVCALVAVWPDGSKVSAQGTCAGTLTHTPRGAGGFGYDPAFVPDDLAGERTMAEISAAEKDAISHRGRAARALLQRIGRG